MGLETYFNISFGYFQPLTSQINVEVSPRHAVGSTSRLASVNPEMVGLSASLPTTGGVGNYSNVTAEFEIMTDEVKTVLIFVCSLTTLTSVVGNLLAILIFAKGKRSKTDLRPFLINLAVADLIMGIFCIPFTFTSVIVGYWIFPDPMCTVVLFLQVLSVTASVSTNMAIGIDRFFAVSYPLKLRITASKATYTIAVIWIIAIGISSVQFGVAKVRLFGSGELAKMTCDEYWENRTQRMVYTWVILFLTCIIPLCMLTITYSIVARMLWRRTVPGNADEVRDQMQIKAKRKVIKMLITIVVLFGICWLPLHVFIMVLDYNSHLENKHKKSLTLFYIAMHWLAMSNSFMNPIIYGFMNDNFRADLRSFIHYVCPWYNRKLNRKKPAMKWKARTASREHGRSTNDIHLTKILSNTYVNLERIYIQCIVSPLLFYFS